MTGFLNDELHHDYSARMKLRMSLTVPGQANWIALPNTRTCRECKHWGRNRFERDSWGALKAKPCYKAAGLMHRGHRSLPTVPHDAWACSFFEERHWTPTIEREGGK